MTQKAAFEKIIYLDAEVFANAGFIYKAVGIDGDDISREIALSQLDMIFIPLQFTMMESGISYLDIIVLLV